MENKRPIPDEAEEERGKKMAEITQRMIGELRGFDADFTKKMFPPLYTAAWVMVEYGATSRQDLDAATRSLKEFMDRIQKEQNKNQNRASRNNNRE